MSKGLMKGSLYNNNKHRSRDDEKGIIKRMLITINVVGSSGPLRFVVKEEDLVCEVIHIALKSYAHQARLPLLGNDATNFLLYSSNSEYDSHTPLNPRETIGSKQARNFVLCKKAGTPSPLPNKKMKKLMTIKETHGWNWKAWINKSLSFKILSH